ncbi:hypothetical protein D3C76_1787010 [compost metagenome]
MPHARENPRLGRAHFHVGHDCGKQRTEQRAVDTVKHDREKTDYCHAQAERIELAAFNDLRDVDLSLAG